LILKKELKNGFIKAIYVYKGLGYEIKFTIVDEEEYPDVIFTPICGVCQPKITYYKGEVVFNLDGAYDVENAEEVIQSVKNAKILAEYIRDNLDKLLI